MANDTAAHSWEDVELWMHNWMAAHPDETRDELEIYLSTDYDTRSQYWPLRDVNGTLIDFNAPKGGEWLTAHSSPTLPKS